MTILTGSEVGDGKTTGGGWLVGGTMRVGTTTMAVGKTKVGSGVICCVSGIVVGAPLVVRGVRVGGCVRAVSAAVAVSAIFSSDGAPDKLQALSTKASRRLSAR
jgi:hypothetical protein